MRYQMQDMRCSKTNRVATHFLQQVSKCAAEFKLDIEQEEARKEMKTLQGIARYHELEELHEVVEGILKGFNY